MTERNPSQTAFGAAALRAAHQLIDAEPKILEDPVILRLLDASFLEGIRAHPERLATPHSRALRTHILVRSRFAEERLAAAVERGVRQYVLLGAGLDTFAYRQPAWAGELRIFEVDQPASQEEKRARLEAAGIPAPANLTYLAVDFERDELLPALQRGGFDPHQAAFFSWLGVIVYLRRAAVESVFRAVASLPRSSEIVFTFGSQGRGQSAGATRARAAALGEPWLSHFTPEAIEQMLRGMGFTEVSFLTPDEIWRRYLHLREDGLFALQRINTASARL